MTRRGLALAAAMTAGLAALALSCSQVIGVADPGEDVVADMCICLTPKYFLTRADCAGYLRGQLDGVTDTARAAWLDHYAAHCGKCTEVLECFYTPPACVTLSCHQDAECCSARDGGGCDLDAGLCY